MGCAVTTRLASVVFRWVHQRGVPSQRRPNLITEAGVAIVIVGGHGCWAREPCCCYLRYDAGEDA